jgi:hypothetical protein
MTVPREKAGLAHSECFGPVGLCLAHIAGMWKICFLTAGPDCGNSNSASSKHLIPFS